MVAITAHHATQILLAPVVKEPSISIAQFVLFPFVKCFVHDQESHPITDGVKLWILRIMTGANGIASHVSQYFQLMFECTRIESGARASEVMMQAYALDICALAIEDEPPVLSKLD